MSPNPNHPDSEMLFLAALGELHPEEAAMVEAHVAQCDACREESAEIRQTGEEFRSIYQNEFKSRIPEPPRGWSTFGPRLLEPEPLPKPEPLLGAWRKAVWNPRRMMPAAAAACILAVLGVLVYRMGVAPPAVSAKAILDRAAEAQHEQLSRVSRATVYQKLRVRVGSETYIRTLYRDVARERQVDHWTGAGDKSAGASLEPAVVNIAATRFSGMRLDWRDPLSPSLMRDWLDVRGQREQSAAGNVVESQGTFTVTSLSELDPVREARFVLRESDHHPLSAYFQFQDKEDLELTELAYSIQPVDSVDRSIQRELGLPEPPVSVAASHAGTDAGETKASPEPNPDGLELQARSILHAHGADIGEETDVSRTDGVVSIKGLVASPERRKELQEALRDLPGIRIELRTAEEAAKRQAQALTGAEEPAGSEPAAVAALHDAMAQRYPDQRARDAFVLGTLECSQRTVSRGFALRRLADRYTAAAEASLPDDSRRQLHEIAADHREALNTSFEELVGRLAPFAGDLPAISPGPHSAERGRPWQDVQRPLLEDLRTLHELVVSLVSGSTPQPADQDALIAKYRACGARIRETLRMLGAE